MNLLLGAVWMSRAVVWALVGNPWLSALFGLNAGFWFGNFIAQDL